MKEISGIICLLGMLLLSSCSQEGPTMAGGSATDVGDANGVLQLEEGQVAADAIVKLIPKNAKPSDVDTLPLQNITNTGPSGTYRFSSVAQGGYNLVAHHPVSGKRLFAKDIHIEEGEKALPDYVLTAPGVAQISLTDSLQYSGAIAHILGTDISRMIPQNSFATGHFFWDSLPTGELPPLWFTWESTGESKSAAINKSLTIISQDTAQVGIHSIHAIRSSTAPVIDGDLSDFPQTRSLTLSNAQGTQGNYYFAWNDTALFIAAQVTDSDLNAVTPNTVRDAFLSLEDGIELMVDVENIGGALRDSNDYKFFVNLLNAKTDNRGSLIDGEATWNGTFYSQVKFEGTVNDPSDTDVGYTLEMAIPIRTLGISSLSLGTALGFDLVCNDLLPSGNRISTTWANNNGDKIIEEGSSTISINDPEGWGTLILEE